MGIVEVAWRAASADAANRRKDDVDLRADELGGRVGEALDLSVAPSRDSNVTVWPSR